MFPPLWLGYDHSSVQSPDGAPLFGRCYSWHAAWHSDNSHYYKGVCILDFKADVYKCHL